MVRFRLLLRLLMALCWAGGMVLLAWKMHYLAYHMQGEAFLYKEQLTRWQFSIFHVSYMAWALAYFSPAVFLTLLHWAFRTRP